MFSSKQRATRAGMGRACGVCRARCRRPLHAAATARRAARERPSVPILALTPELQTARHLAIVWGVHCLHTEDAIDFQDMVEKACTAAREQGFARLGDRIVITAGVPFGTPGSTNVLRIAWVGN